MTAGVARKEAGVSRPFSNEEIPGLSQAEIMKEKFVKHNTLSP